MAAMDRVDGHEADIVTVVLIFGAGIAETRDKKHCASPLGKC